MTKEQKKYWKKARRNANKALEAIGQFGLDAVMAGEIERFRLVLSTANTAIGLINRKCLDVERENNV